MKVNWLSSCSFFQSCVLYAFTLCIGLRLTSLEALWAASGMAVASAAVLPIKVIFLSAIDAIGSSGSLNGGLSVPTIVI